MKKLFRFLLLAAVALVGCNKTDDLGPGKQAEGMFSLTVEADNGIHTRAGEITILPEIEGYQTRYILEIYHQDAEGANKLYYRSESQVANATNSNSANVFNFRLLTNQTYNFLVWVDYTADGSDLHYKTNGNGGLQNVSLIEKILNNDHSRDAFFGKSTFTTGNSATNISMTCKRPFGQLNVKTTDWEYATVKGNPALEPKKVQMEIGGYRAFNLLTGDVVGEKEAISYNNNQPIIGGSSDTEKNLTCDYLFAPNSGSGVVNTVMTFYNKDGAEITNTGEMLSNLPVQQNYKTNVSGKLLTKQGKLNVVVDAEWEGTLDYSIVLKVSQLQAAIDAAPKGKEKYEFFVLEYDTPTDNLNVNLNALISGVNVKTEEIHLTFGDQILTHNIITATATTNSYFTGKVVITGNNAACNLSDNFSLQGTLVVRGVYAMVNSRAAKTVIDGHISGLGGIVLTNSVRLNPGSYYRTALELEVNGTVRKPANVQTGHNVRYIGDANTPATVTVTNNNQDNTTLYLMADDPNNPVTWNKNW